MTIKSAMFRKKEKNMRSKETYINRRTEIKTITQGNIVLNRLIWNKK